MRIAVAFVILVVALAVFPEPSAGWFRRVVRTVTRAARHIPIVRKVERVVRNVRTIADMIRKSGKKRDADDPFLFNGDMTDDELITALTTRDISDLVDVSQVSEAELAELEAVQRDARELASTLNLDDDDDM